MAVTGRPSKLTVELQTKICDMLRAGNYLETAAAYAGVSKTTLYSWMRRGNAEVERVNQLGGKGKVRKKEQPFVDFLYAIEKSLSEGEVRDLIIISNAAKTDWKAAAWKLERKFPDKWGRKDRMEAKLHHSGENGGPIKTEQSINLANLSDEELSVLEGIVAKSAEPAAD